MSEKKYFLNLNYSLANEDTNFERQIILKTKPKKIVSVCGSGSRSLPLLHEGVESLTCVDLSQQQLWLAHLRAESIKKLDHEEFLLFWGYAPYSATENRSVRERMFNSLPLDDQAKLYFSELYSSHEWKSVLYTGKWEKTFIFFSKVIDRLIGKNVVDKLFSFEDIAEQRNYVQTAFPRTKWKLLMTILGNKPLFNALLYKGDFIKKNVDESYLDYYSKAFSHLMNHDLCKTSFFLQLCFLGEIKYAEGNLVEARKECFESMKKALSKCELKFVKKDIISAIKDETNVDFISISDVPSYFSGEMEKNFFQEILPSISVNGIVVNRNYLRVPEANRSIYKNITNKYISELSNEKVQMYRIEVLQNA